MATIDPDDLDAGDIVDTIEDEDEDGFAPDPSTRDPNFEWVSEPNATTNVKRRRRVRTGARPKVLARRELRLAVIADRAEKDVPFYVREERPKTRGDCAGGARPCPWVGCKYNLYLSVNPENGSIVLTFPDMMPWDLHDTCALDVAERGGITLEEVGAIMNLTRERIRQVESKGLAMMKEAAPDLADE